MTLPRMDIPVGVIDWEVFAPQIYSMQDVDGDAIPRRLLERVAGKRAQSSSVSRAAGSLSSAVGSSAGIVISLVAMEPSGTVRGVVRDGAGVALPGVTIEVASLGRAALTAVSGGDGTFRLSGIPQGVATIKATLSGFNTAAANFVVGTVGNRVDIQMQIGSVEETITVTAPRVDPWDPAHCG